MTATPYAAFLRAVNVGGTGKLPMADLRALIEGIGGRQPRTYIASGNAVFTHQAEAAMVQSALEAALQEYAGRPMPLLLRTPAQLTALLDSLPFPEAAPAKVAILLTDEKLSGDPQAEASHRSVEEIRPGPRALWIHYPEGMGRSKLTHPAIKSGTLRNLNTLRKVQQMAAAADEGK
ncbi:DUF1697 domain-containing protein [Ponticoccus alexandrii]|uniref:DUF1697 domain-containing protein n=1 Tax=Ponticoccus alexandrii TaxID=1943633 RepID=A0ABX7FAA5_9RHOB|nr:DUF1697 domain-containing protein [Ponticoccus alexandrii]ETA52672.1 hypothetical protein P279_07365 [Rhodobacteraceae bacterium PD-2]QRF67061.1 DUF1697 domain-containing protein [Ponticoccus alexandrii]